MLDEPTQPLVNMVENTGRADRIGDWLSKNVTDQSEIAVAILHDAGGCMSAGLQGRYHTSSRPLCEITPG